MCHSVLRLCPSCGSNVRHFRPCPSGTELFAGFKYTTLEAEVCAATKALLSIRFEHGTCNDCIRRQRNAIKAEAAAMAKIEGWHADLDTLTSRTLQQGRISPFRPEESKRSERYIADKEAGRNALIQLWYDEEKTRRLRFLIDNPGQEMSPISPVTGYNMIPDIIYTPADH